MSELDTIRDLARQTLIVPTVASEPDSFLWYRAERLVRNVEHICGLPELLKAGLQTDRFCLMSATYFSDAGLACHLESNNRTADLTLSNGNGLLEVSAELATKKLAGIIEKIKIEKISSIITESGSHLTQRTEAMILSDARNLDDMGAVGIFNEYRRFVIGGKGICGVLQSWRKKTDYGYWQARLKEGFKFEQVRKLAERRLATAEYFINQLKAETQAQDVEELSVDSVLV
jgi:hypothetical protein